MFGKMPRRVPLVLLVRVPVDEPAPPVLMPLGRGSGHGAPMSFPRIPPIAPYAPPPPQVYDLRTMQELQRYQTPVCPVDLKISQTGLCVRPDRRPILTNAF